MASRKGRDQTPAVTEDPHPERIRKAYVGTLTVDVRTFSTKWSDYANRDIDTAHIMKLKTQFMAGLRRTEPENYMKATVTTAQWAELLNETAKIAESDVQSLELQLLSHKVIPAARNLSFSPTLEAGQHRKRALEILLLEQSQLSQTPEGVEQGVQLPKEEDYDWVVDFFVREKLEPDSLFALRTNRDKVSKVDASGDLLARLDKILHTKPLQDQQRLLKPQRFHKWIVQVSGSSPDHVGRLLHVMRSEVLRPLIVKYCQTRYGAHHMKLTWSSNIVLSCLDFIWKNELRTWLDRASELFGKFMTTIPNHDWEAIMDIPTKNRDDTLRLLFFPTMSDFKNGLLSSKILQLPTLFASTARDMPEIPEITIDDLVVNTRRPQFLDAMNTDDYVATFRFLRDHPDYSLPHHKHFAELESVGGKVSQLLSHVATWFNQSWVPPKRAEERRKTFSWDIEIVKVVLQESDLESGGARGFNADESLIDIARSLIMSLWMEVRDNGIWNDPVVRDEMRVDASTAIGMNPSTGSVNKYTARFLYRHWRFVLGLFRDKAGPALDGFMKDFNKPDNNAREELLFTTGGIATTAIFRDNQSIVNNRLLNTREMRALFSDEINTCAAFLCYKKLKTVLIDTIQDGYPTTLTRKSKKELSTHVENKAEFDATKAEMLVYADFLAQKGKNLSLDDFHEFMDAEPRLGFLSATLEGEVLLSSTTTSHKRTCSQVADTGIAERSKKRKQKS